jgi:SapC
MQINPPFGYSEIVPLYKNQKVRLPAPGALPEFCRAANAVPITYSEFAVACRDYPLAFITTDQGKSFTPVAVLGIAGGENLYLRDGGWDASAYVPAYVRRYPFCMTRVTLDSVEQADRLICVEKAFLADGGERMFDDGGAPLPRWEPIGKLLQEYEADLERSREMCAIFADYALLEPFTLQAVLKDGGAMNLGGMHRIEERKLEFLNAAQHKNLIRKGIMGRIYAHLISLENFARLLARKNSLAAEPAKTG